MARDFDFRVRRVTNKPPVPKRPLSVTAKTVRTSGSNGLLWIIIIFLLVAAAIGIWQFFALSTPSPTSVRNITEMEPVSTSLSPTTENEDDAASLQNNAPNIQIYDSGAGSAAVEGLADKLKALGYKVENLQQSQFNYDRTYIRYRAGMQSEAEKIQSTMPERLVSLKQVVSAGLFDILILYGVK